MTPFLSDDIAQDEGCRLRAYKDTVGIWTCGYGHANVEPGTVWTQAEANAHLAGDIHIAIGMLDAHLPWWREMNDVRQDVFANLSFNLGISRLMGFKNMLAAAKAGDFKEAAQQLLDSKWATQVHGRAIRLAEQLNSGIRS